MQKPLTSTITNRGTDGEFDDRFNEIEVPNTPPPRAAAGTIKEKTRGHVAPNMRGRAYAEKLRSKIKHRRAILKGAERCNAPGSSSQAVATCGTIDSATCSV